MKSRHKGWVTFGTPKNMEFYRLRTIKRARYKCQLNQTSDNLRC